MTLLRGRHAPLLAVLAPAVTLFLPALGHAAPSADPALTAALDVISKKLDAERVSRNLPSLSVAVVHGHDIVLARAFGMADVDRKLPAKPEMIYPAGSTTKVLVATMLMQLVERGVVRLDDPVAKHVELRMGPDGHATGLSMALFDFRREQEAHAQ
jgi:CubicO group peptidase (beta-lactamase class C family)